MLENATGFETWSKDPELHKPPIENTNCLKLETCQIKALQAWCSTKWRRFTNRTKS